MSKFREALTETLLTTYVSTGLMSKQFELNEVDEFVAFAKEHLQEVSDEEIALNICQKTLKLLADYKDLLVDYDKLVQRNDELSAWLLKEQGKVH